MPTKIFGTSSYSDKVEQVQDRNLAYEVPLFGVRAGIVSYSLLCDVLTPVSRNKFPKAPLMNDTPEPENREAKDRRKQPTSPWAAFRRGGRRLRNRRDEEHRLPYFVDRFPARVFVLIVLLLIATLADGMITIYLLDAGSEEINPLMEFLLREGVWAFLLGKYLLTVVGLPFLLIFKNHYLFSTRFRVGYLLPLFIALYLVLLAYQISLCYRIAM